MMVTVTVTMMGMRFMLVSDVTQKRSSGGTASMHDTQRMKLPPKT